MNEIVPFQKEIQATDKISQSIFNYVRLEEARKILDVTTNPRNHLFINTLWQTGARISEVLTLRPCDVSNEGILIITLKKRLQQKRRTKSGSWTELKNPVLKQKTLKRIIPINSDLLAEFMAYAYKNNIKTDKRFFDIGRARAFQIVQDASIHAGITYKAVYPHLFRHGFAINYIRCGGMIQNLKEIMGHSSVLTTMIYLRVAQPDIHEDFAKMVF